MDDPKVQEISKDKEKQKKIKEAIKNDSKIMRLYATKSSVQSAVTQIQEGKVPDNMDDKDVQTTTERVIKITAEKSGIPKNDINSI